METVDSPRIAAFAVGGVRCAGRASAFHGGAAAGMAEMAEMEAPQWPRRVASARSEPVGF